MEERLIKKLMTSIGCDFCGQHYEMSGIDIIGHREDLWFLNVSCPAWHTRCLMAAVVKESRMSGEVVGPAEEASGRFDKNAIDVDDVLSMHVFLKDFDGDFSRLLAQK